ncbi:SDR family oxidoreductase [Paenibacillus allorhizosphaerae]|uniref:Aurachin B dehydrogenase n=1 Tax=Paenibacillus allorhizosphaerae TaxID=2849866 RepID=A0ABN7TBG2_9BACL|nr:SDR family oxidoreductase [Paenibacillus allorhizosphaerae]CAG7616708.1 Aurachin B dehydrogenase [Paenibacillus allorhizosphaerae]
MFVIRAFVTGSTGLLGNNLVRLLLQEGFEVRALARSRNKAEAILGGTGADIVVGDMNDIDAFAPAMKGCDVLFHTAAYFREAFAGRSNHWPMLQRINVDNTVRLFEQAQRHGVGKVIHTSSNAAIRKRSDGKASEESDVLLSSEAPTPYARSKILGDKAIAEYAHKSQLPVTTVLPAWMFGPGDAAPTSSGKFVLDYMNRRLQGVFDSGFDVVDARDVAAAMLAAASRGKAGERYIIAAHHASLAELGQTLKLVTGVEEPKRSVSRPMIYAVAWLSETMAALSGKETNLTVDSVRVLTGKLRTSSDKAKRELGIQLRPLEETLRDTAEWLRLNPLGV